MQYDKNAIGLRVATRLVVTIGIISLLSLYYTLNLNNILFNQKDGIVTRLANNVVSDYIENSQSRIRISGLIRNNSASFMESDPLTIGDVQLLKDYPTMKIGMSLLENDELERSCDNIEKLVHPIEQDRKLTSAEKCEFVSTSCSENLIYTFYYCLLENRIGFVWLSRIIFYAFAIYGTVMMFYVLANTADDYFSPSLLKLSEYLKLPPNLAGVTLLALGSGAPELCSIVAGLVNNNSDLAISVPIGGGMFVTSVVVGSVALCSTVRVARRPFLRDVGSYFIAVFFIFIVYLDGRIRLFEGVICFILYVLYVALVVIGRCIYQSRKRKRLHKIEEAKKRIKTQMQAPFLTNMADNEMDEFDYESTGDRGVYFSKPVFNTNPDKSRLVKESDGIFVPKIGIVLPGTAGALSVKQFEEMNAESKNDEETDLVTTDNKLSNTTPVISNYFAVHDIEYDDDLPEKLTLTKFLLSIYEATGLNEKGILGKLFFFLGGWFWDLVRTISIPNSEPDKWNKYLACITPFFGTMFFIHIIFDLFSLYDKWSWWMLMAWISPGLISVVFGIFVFFTAERKKPPIYNPIFVTFSFILCMIWIFFAADNLVKILEVIGATLSIPPSVLGITVLAWGNSIGDMIANIVIARAGYATMAIGASYASPLLNALIGLGMSFFFNSIRSFTNNPGAGVWSGFCFETQGDPALTVTFIFLLFTLLLSLCCVPIMRFRIRKCFALVLFTVYVIYILLAMTASLVPPVGNAILKISLPTAPNC